MKRIGYLPSLLTLMAALSSCGFAQDGTPSSDPQQILEGAIASFAAGRIDESLAGFDRVVELVPGAAPQLWQRGIALYYAERWEDCRTQFELHRTVNPNDVENAVWHYLCVARLSSPQGAREALLPVGPDPRSPMPEIYEMFQGRRTPDEVLTAASGVRGRFYAELYLALWYEAEGQTGEALAHLRNAAADEYQSSGGYMHMVATVHLGLRSPLENEAEP